jgi:hypothetical protein
MNTRLVGYPLIGSKRTEALPVTRRSGLRIVFSFGPPAGK